MNNHTPAPKDNDLELAESLNSTNKYGLPRVVVILLALAAAWLALQGIHEYSDIIAPVFLGINMMIVAMPIKTFMVKKGIAEPVGAIVAGITVLIVLILFFWSLIWSSYAFVFEMPHYSAEFEALWEDTLNILSRFGIGQQQLESSLHAIEPSNLIGVAQSFLSSLKSVLGILLIVVTVLIFLVMDASGFDSRIKIAQEHNPRFVRALGGFAAGIRRYWVVSTTFGLIVAVLDWGALVIIGVPLPLVWAVLSFVTNYIPNIGFVIGLVPPAIMALLEKGPIASLIVIIAYCVLNFVIQSIIQPKIAGDAVGVTPTISFLSLIIWAAILGPLGAILALPATLLVKAFLVDIDPRTRWINSFIAAKPKTAGIPLRKLQARAHFKRSHEEQKAES